MQKLTSIFTISLTGICCFLAAAQFILSNDMASAGQTVAATDQQITALQDENEFLKQQLAVAQSLTVISKKAAELGFVTPAKYVTIQTDQPVALR